MDEERKDTDYCFNPKSEELSLNQKFQNQKTTS